MFVKLKIISIYILLSATAAVSGVEWRYSILDPTACVSLQSGVADEGLVVQRQDDPESYSSVLLRFDLSDVPENIKLDSTLFAEYDMLGGSGLSPNLVLYEVENGWDSETVTVDSIPCTIQALAELKVNPKLQMPAVFRINEFIQSKAGNGSVSLLVEMNTPSGEYNSIRFSGKPRLSVAAARMPDRLLRPVWRGGRVEEETILATSYDGQPAEANLLFEPSNFIHVQNVALTKTYTEGKDFIIDGRVLRLTKNSTAPFLNYEDLYHKNPHATPGVMHTLDGGYLTFAPSSFFAKHSVVVTYEHEQKWTGPVPDSKRRFLPRTFEKLENGSPFTLVVYGDSISAGANASGQNVFPPFMPRWSDLVADQLEQTYGVNINYINTAIGGNRTDRRLKLVDHYVTRHRPDLVILGFGMNDAGGVALSTEAFMKNMRYIMQSVRKQNPNVEFILLMSLQPNSCWRDLGLMEEYLDALKKEEGPGIALVDVWSIHGYLLKHKTYWDMTGNHVNHPNDFLVRIYAQAILASLEATD
jgi:lysophospholipase L1-like esterase